MKKISIPSDPVPNVYIDNKPVEVKESVEFVEAPPSELYGINLKGMKVFNDNRRNWKMDSQMSVFKSKVHERVLKFYPVERSQMNKDLLICVLNLSENFFIYGNAKERKQMKEQCIEELLTPYFKNDTEVLNAMVCSVWSCIKKSNFCKRVCKCVSNYFKKN
jgi:hypothetical protein